ncbi:MAG: hypothetical protein M0R80_02445 [Proteobacteria bacterium]|jgi:3-polyprenyl-4-hydroxybenzoate decarboxylase|nr:hypothetical protein [Pseudomonadota bacterium]
MNKPNILLGITGSVATVLVKKMCQQLSEIGNVEIVSTESAMHFIDKEDITGFDLLNCRLWRDIDEWQWSRPAPQPPPSQAAAISDVWKKDDPVVHINLRDWADVFVIAPLSANTLAKMANGLCDNLLTSVFRAWDWAKPVIVAPAMNTRMWESPFTEDHLFKLVKLFGDQFQVIPPQKKMLACGDEGKGAMADISLIVEKLKWLMKWQFPIEHCPGIPINYHPGAFAFPRRQSNHTGVDLYTPRFYVSEVHHHIRSRENCTIAHAVESGRVVATEHFTGEQDESPWWNNTDCLLVEGRSGVVCYGEIKPYTFSVGDIIVRGQPLGEVIPVLKEGKERPDIPGHSRAMLHIELYKHGTKSASKSWKLGQPKHDYIADPTPFLCESINAPKERLVWDNPEKKL